MFSVPAAALLHGDARELATGIAATLPLGAPVTEVATDLRFVIEAIAVAVELQCAGLVDRMLEWQKVRTRALGGDPNRLEQVPQLVLAHVRARLDSPAVMRVLPLLDGARAFLRHASSEPPPPEAAVVGDGPAARLLAAALAGDRLRAQAAVRPLSPPEAVLAEVVEPVLREVGRRWQAGLLTPPQEHFVSQLVHTLVADLAAAPPAPPDDAPLVALVRAANDEHSLGQLCLQIHLRAAGLVGRVVGMKEDAASVVEPLEALAPAAIAFTCTTPGHLTAVRAAIEVVRRRPSLARLPVLLGGGIVRHVPQLASLLGADGGAADGTGAARQLRAMTMPVGAGR